ncbi:transcription factor MYB13-like [Hibiscus syriacus]|uniref:transcription factor MYB13-like n=1 Tax=Hibiscus syriacus TaxID=106335 RepID=UPI001920AF78|nr:transcription factor MYB13-like [Hibiscus syriacus]
MRYGIWNWNEMPRFAGLQRSRKSCRLRWMNYLRPDIRHGNFTREEETIIHFQKKLGNRCNSASATTETQSSIEENSCNAESSSLLIIPTMDDFPEQSSYNSTFSSSENYWEMLSFMEQPLIAQGFEFDCEASATTENNSSIEENW